MRRKRGRPRKTWMEGVQAAMTTGNLEPDEWRNRGMAFGVRKTATGVKKTGQIEIVIQCSRCVPSLLISLP